MAKVKYETKQLVPCEQHRAACLAYSNGKCRALHDTHFKRRCPFFKTKAMLREQMKGAR